MEKERYGGENMFKVGSYVVYKSNGLCIIDDVRKEKFGNLTRQDYYVLKLLSENGSVIYVPVEKEENEKSMRPPISKEDAKKLVAVISDLRENWISDDKMRAARYKDILERADVKKLAGLVNTLKEKSEELCVIGRRLRSIDEMIMKKAETNLRLELDYALK